MSVQRCPNCGREHDVRVYVTGQRILCNCGIRFDVRRGDSSGASSVRKLSNESALAATAVRQPTPAAAPGTEPTAISQTAQKVEIAGYALRELLGRGGMGEVWRAEQQSLGRMVAIKVLPPRLAKDPEFVARFAKEATALASLSHPNIVQIIDRGVSGDHYYFVMEYVEGTNLRDRMGGGPLPPAEALKIATQLCHAVDAAHERHIIHRDLKPENILVDARGHVKVADFGLAGFRSAETDQKLTGTAVAMGTVNYMAPEQRRDAGMVDGRADIYSVGVVLYEMLTGELPLGRFKPPSERVSNIDPRLDAVVMRALESDPEARFARASLLGETLDRFVAESSGSGQSAITTVEGAGPDRRRRWVRGAAWVGGLAVVATIAVLVAQQVGQDPNDGHGHAGAGRWPRNTDHAIGVEAKVVDEKGEQRVEIGFEPGEEVLNAHAGHWRLRDGRLRATQAGDDAGDQALLAPRTYLGKRYFSSDDVRTEVEMNLRPLESDFPVEERAQRYAELSFRVTNLQVSVLAIPKTGMRVAWRYFRPDGRTVAGNSSSDVADLVAEEAPFPGFNRTFRVGLTLRKRGAGVEVEARIDGAVFFRRTLEGLQGHVAKAALGCRNMHCEFDNLRIAGKPAAKTPEGPAGSGGAGQAAR